MTLSEQMSVSQLMVLAFVIETLVVRHYGLAVIFVTPLTIFLAEATHLLVSIPPGAAGDPVLARHSEDIAAAKRLRWIGYLSTVGIYGDQAGGWVDETTPPRPRPGRATAGISCS